MLDTMRIGKDGDREQRTLYILITHTEKAGRSTPGRRAENYTDAQNLA